MSQAPIEVRVHARGSVREGSPKPDPSMEARCDLCGATVDAVASVGPEARAPFACKSCLRERLEGITVALWMLKDAEKGLPWGKISG
jgi:hypothetical protein